MKMANFSLAVTLLVCIIHLLNFKQILTTEPQRDHKITPYHYDVELKFPVKTLDSYYEVVLGKVNILAVNNLNRTSVTFGGRELEKIEISKSSIKLHRSKFPNEDVRIKDITNSNGYDWIFELDEEILVEEKIQLSMEFTLSIDGCPGATICFSEYENDKVEMGKYYESTPLPFNRIFPGFVLPHLRATHNMTIVRPTGLTALFNSDLISSEAEHNESGWVRDKFATTMKLSPFEIAVFLVQNFTFLESNYGKKIARTYVPGSFVDKVPDLKSTSEKVGRILNFYEGFFGDYSRVPKFELIIAPGSDFRGWRTRGISKVNPDAFNNNPILDYPYNKQQYSPNVLDGLEGYRETSFLTHILSEQWLPGIWNEFSESTNPKSGLFPTSLQRYLLHICMEDMTSDTIGNEARILRDSQLTMLASTQAHELVLSDFELLLTKLPSLLRMIEGAITRPTMRKAFQFYVRTMSDESHVSPNDFFEAIGKAALEDHRYLPASIVDIMKRWYEDGGIPLVRIDVVNITHVSFSQTRFKTQSKVQEEDEHGSELGYLPVSYVSQDMPDNVRIVWLKNDKVEVVEHNVSQWILANPNATGYHRTLYSDDLLQLIQAQMKGNMTGGIISGMSQSQLLDDYMNLALENYVSHEHFLKLATFLEHERHLGVWEVFLRYNDHVLKKFLAHPNYRLVQTYIRTLAEGGLADLEEYPRIGSTIVLQRDLEQLGCSAQSPHCEVLASTVLQKWKENPDSLVEKGFECRIVAFGGETAFQFVHRKILEMENPSVFDQDFFRLVRAMTCATDVDIIQNLINKTLYPEELNQTPEYYSSPFAKVYEALASNPDAIGYILPFLSSKRYQLQGLLQYYYHETMNSVVKALSERFLTEGQLKEMESFMELIGLKQNPEDIDFRDKIRNNIAWMKSDGNMILSWISTKVASTKT